MNDLALFLLGTCWGAFVVGLVLVLREGWKRGKEPWSPWGVYSKSLHVPEIWWRLGEHEGWNPRRYGEGE